jgi:hypothetical protein
MTNREALTAAVALPVNGQEIDKALTDAEINPAMPYVKASQLLIDNAAIEVLQGQKSTKSIQQGGFTITLDLAAINERIQYLAKRCNREDLLPTVAETAKPTIRNISHLW